MFRGRECVDTERIHEHHRYPQRELVVHDIPQVARQPVRSRLDTSNCLKVLRFVGLLGHNESTEGARNERKAEYDKEPREERVFGVTECVFACRRWEWEDCRSNGKSVIVLSLPDQGLISKRLE